MARMRARHTVAAIGRPRCLDRRQHGAWRRSSEKHRTHQCGRARIEYAQLAKKERHGRPMLNLTLSLISPRARLSVLLLLLPSLELCRLISELHKTTLCYALPVKLSLRAEPRQFRIACLCFASQPAELG